MKVVSIPEELHTKLKIEAVMHGMTFKDYIKMLLEGKPDAKANA